MSELSAIRRKGITPYILPPKIYKGTRLIYDITMPAPKENTYFYVESLEDENVISFTKNANANDVTYYVSTNLYTWTEHSDTYSWTLNANERLYFKATTTYYATHDGGYGWTFSSTKTYIVAGNALSLLYGDNFSDKRVLPNVVYMNLSTFGSLFKNSTHLISAKNLLLAVGGTTFNCYAYMFSGCTSLVEAPELPAKEAGNYCYCAMFNTCRSLLKAPDLPATILRTGCYDAMFQSCTSLVETPVLPAIEGANACYYAMFYSCSSLRKATCYLDVYNYNDYVGYCYDWLYGVAGSGDLYVSRYSDWPANTIPSGWTKHIMD